MRREIGHELSRLPSHVSRFIFVTTIHKTFKNQSIKNPFSPLSLPPKLNYPWQQSFLKKLIYTGTS